MKKLKKILLVIIFAVMCAAAAFALCLSGRAARSKQTMSEQSGISLPIIMYHSLLKDEKLQNDYTISPELFESDLKYLTENGYEAVTVEDLIGYVYADKSLPEKCVMLTFDDGYYNNYYYALPLLKKYNCRAVVSPIAYMSEKFTQTSDVSVTYGHITYDDIREMSDSGYVEFQNHSYNMHALTPRNGVCIKYGESESDYRAALIADVSKAQEILKSTTGKTARCFVYPFGAQSDMTESIIKDMGFLCTLTCTEKPNLITESPDSLYGLGRYRRDKSETMQALMDRIN